MKNCININHIYVSNRHGKLFSALRRALFNCKCKTQAIRNLSIKGFFELFKTGTLQERYYNSLFVQNKKL